MLFLNRLGLFLKGILLETPDKKLLSFKVFLLFSLGFCVSPFLRFGLTSSFLIIIFWEIFLAVFLWLLTRLKVTISYNRIFIVSFSVLSGLVFGLVTGSWKFALIDAALLIALLSLRYCIGLAYLARFDISSTIRRMVEEMKESLF